MVRTRRAGDDVDKIDGDEAGANDRASHPGHGTATAANHCATPGDPGKGRAQISCAS